VLLLAFAFSVMADPVSSVAYAIEAALRALDGDLTLLLPTMGLVVAIIALVITNYSQLVGRFPEGGGAAAASGTAFGEAWAFIPIGALIVDFVLTIAISVSAAASAAIAFAPELAPWRAVLALVVLLAVAGLTWFGHLGRAVFAVMTLLFVGLGGVIVAGGLRASPVAEAAGAGASGSMAFVAVLLAFPVAMALATGVEAPSSAIAELEELDDDGRRRFGRFTLWLTLGIVGCLTLGLTAVAVRLGTGVPAQGSTLVADIARASVGSGGYGLFQLFTALLLLAATSSSLQAGPGLLKALARHPGPDGAQAGILTSWLWPTNSRHVPYRAVLVFVVLAGIVVLATGGRDQVLVLFYAVAVFLSFLMGLAAMTRFSYDEGRTASTVMNGVGTAIVTFTLAVNLLRGLPLVSLAAAGSIALVLYGSWAHAGRPRGVARAVVLRPGR
jgi:amino acid transporter